MGKLELFVMSRYLKWFQSVVRPYKVDILVMMLCHIFLAFCTISFVYISKALIDMAVGVFSGNGAGHSHTAFPFMEPTSGNMVIWSLLLVSFVLLRIFLSTVRTWLQTRTEISMRNNLRKELFDILLHKAAIESSRDHSGNLVNKLQVDVAVVSSAFAVSIPSLAGAFIQFLAAFAYFVILDVRLALLLLLLMPAGVFAGKFLMLRIRNLTSEIRESDSAVHSYLQESLQHLPVLQAFEYSDSGIGRLDRLQSTVYDNEIRRTRFSILSRVIMSFVFAAAQAVAFLWGVAGIAAGTISYGMMTAFLQLLAQIQRPLVEVSTRLPSVIHCAASIDRLVEIQSIVPDRETEPVFLSGVAGIRFSDVSFAYSGSKTKIFSHFSHDFKPGSRTAVTGPTGVGKSTMMKLMLSFLSPTEGMIEIYDSKSSMQISASARRNFVFVPQGNSLFSGTVRDNLLIGNPQATETQLREALEMAAADFVFDLPAGLDTQCFESGAGLSEGQAQRVAVARALLRPGSILLLDEFSSALDSSTESLLLQRLTSGRPDLTMIFITHREKILEYCDSILQLEQ